MMRTVIAALSLVFLLVVTLVLLFVHQKGMRPLQKMLNLLFPASQIACLVFIYRFIYAYDLSMPFTIAAALGAVLCGVTNIALFRMLHGGEERDLAEERVRILEEQVAMQEEYYEHLSLEMAEADKVLSRISAEIGKADESLREEKGEEAVEQLKDAVGLIEGSKHYCEHKVVDALISTKAMTCEDMDVKAEFDLSVPYDIPVPSVDLCALFSNTIDNALNACSKVDPSERRLVLKADSAGGFFLLDTTNTCADDEADSEDDASQGRGTGLAEHGWGLLIMENIAKRYDGSFEAGRHDDVFRTSVALNLAKQA